MLGVHLHYWFGSSVVRADRLKHYKPKVCTVYVEIFAVD